MAIHNVTPPERKRQKPQTGLRQMYRAHGIKIVHWWRSNGRHKWNYEISVPAQDGLEVICSRRGIDTKAEALSLAQRWIDARWRMLEVLDEPQHKTPADKQSAAQQAKQLLQKRKDSTSGYIPRSTWRGV